MVTELLQQVGLNKYEAEAYAALVLHGPLTGYELGKKSGVPLSRSYEILERLVVQGLALQQPGDPPRYCAEPPEQFVARTRAATLTTLDALGTALADLARPAPADGFWVLRGRAPILAHVRTAIAQSQRSLAISAAPDVFAQLEPALAEARARGCRVTQQSLAATASTIQLLTDERDGLAGTLAPAEHCQAVASSNPGFVAPLRQALQPAAPTLRSSTPSLPARDAQALAWLDWEQRKQRSLLSSSEQSAA